jgi:hypothetical protein
VWDGTSPLPEVNEIWASAIAEITISGAGSDPLVRANRVHDGNYRGIRVSDGASPRIEENEIWAMVTGGIAIFYSGSDPAGADAGGSCPSSAGGAAGNGGG